MMNATEQAPDPKRVAGWRGRPALVAALPPITLALIVAPAAFAITVRLIAANAHLLPISWPVVAFLLAPVAVVTLLVPILVALRIAYRQSAIRYVVTPEALMIERGWLLRKRTAVPLTVVDEFAMTRNAIQLLLGTGHLWAVARETRAVILQLRDIVDPRTARATLNAMLAEDTAGYADAMADAVTASQEEEPPAGTAPPDPPSEASRQPAKTRSPAPQVDDPIQPGGRWW